MLNSAVAGQSVDDKNAAFRAVCGLTRSSTGNCYRLQTDRKAAFLLPKHFPGKRQRKKTKEKDNAHRKMPRHGDDVTNPKTIYKFYARLRNEKMAEAQEYRAHLLRNSTKAERAFAHILDEVRIDYEREYIILLRDFSSRFIDFYSDSAKVGFEVDGGYHKDQVEYDIDRDIGIMSLNILMARFTNDEILEDPEETKSKVEETLWNRVRWWHAHGDYDRMSHWEANQPNE